jgi:predicted short-subunit dehydrogenase-like oxidoreductase (DUF2520 family)
MDLIVVGPGRAGMSLALGAHAAAHRIVGVLARDSDAAQAAAELVDSAPLDWSERLPAADLALIAVRDDAIAEVAGRLEGKADRVAGAAHLSGLVSASALAPLGIPTASFHPLQTLPNPEAGAARLDGAWIAVTSDDDLLSDRLFALAASLGAHPFELVDEQKALYHAAAAAAANTPLAALAMAFRLFEAAGVLAEVVEPLVRAVIDNAFALGPEEALTGPAARGDVGTVRAQVEAVRESVPDLAADFEAFVRAVARTAGTLEIIEAGLE